MENQPISSSGPAGAAPPGGPELVRLAIGFYAGVFALAVGISFGFDHSLLFADASGARAGVAWPRDVALGLLAAAAVVAFSIASDRWSWGAALSDALAEVLGPLSLRACLGLAALSGVAEEALFRGALQPQIGWVAASVVFGLAHFAPRRDLWPWTVFSLVVGFGLGGLYLWTGNLVAPVVAHAGINAVNLRRLSRRAAKRSG